jgi:hypothetical protein
MGPSVDISNRKVRPVATAFMAIPLLHGAPISTYCSLELPIEIITYLWHKESVESHPRRGSNDYVLARRAGLPGAR